MTKFILLNLISLFISVILFDRTLKFGSYDVIFTTLNNGAIYLNIIAFLMFFISMVLFIACDIIRRYIISCGSLHNHTFMKSLFIRNKRHILIRVAHELNSIGMYLLISSLTCFIQVALGEFNILDEYLDYDFDLIPGITLFLFMIISVVMNLLTTSFHGKYVLPDICNKDE